MGKQFGGKITQKEKDVYAKSKHWDGDKFNNLEHTEMKIPFRAMPKLIFNQIFRRNVLSPNNKVPVSPFNKTAFLAPSDRTKFIWFGHSALLCRIEGKTILIDPMFGPDAAPIAPFKIKRFNEVSTDLIADLPEIDLLIMSHDHYDHLDLKSMEVLAPKVKNYFTALGVSRHLTAWGIAEEKIQEFDWWQTKIYEGIEITFTPTRHFSGRGIRDRFKGLWGGWIFKTESENIWFSGDGGYGNHFKEVGAKFGPFDLAFMECGQFNKLWRPIHLFPDECIQAATEAKANLVMPVHWGSFTLSDHHWTASVEEFVEESKSASIPYLTPKIGVQFSIEDASDHRDSWWRQMN